MSTAKRTPEIVFYHHCVEVGERVVVDIYSHSSEPTALYLEYKAKQEAVMQRYSAFLLRQPKERRGWFLDRGIFPPSNNWRFSIFLVREPKAPRNTGGLRTTKMKKRIMKKAPLFAEDFIAKELEEKADYYAGMAGIDFKRRANYIESKAHYERSREQAEENNLSDIGMAM